MLRGWIASFGGLAIPLRRFRMIARDAGRTSRIDPCELQHRADLAQLRCLAPPPGRLPVVVAVFSGEALPEEIVRGARLSLGGGNSRRLGGRGHVPSSAAANEMKASA